MYEYIIDLFCFCLTQAQGNPKLLSHGGTQTRASHASAPLSAESDVWRYRCVRARMATVAKAVMLGVDAYTRSLAVTPKPLLVYSFLAVAAAFSAKD